jgi:hypothetical protein
MTSLLYTDRDISNFVATPDLSNEREWPTYHFGASANLLKIDTRNAWQCWVMRPLIFGLPLLIVAAWCDLQPSWKLMAWTAFCIVWYGATDRIGARPNDDRQQPKPPVTLLTKAQIAELAKSSRPD